MDRECRVAGKKHEPSRIAERKLSNLKTKLFEIRNSGRARRAKMLAEHAR